MKNIINSLRPKLFFVFILCGMLFSSCEDYLDQAPESGISKEDIFKEFTSFQGYVEDLYNLITNISIGGDPNLADDTRMNVTFFMNEGFDNGNYWQWNTQWATHFGRVGVGDKVANLYNLNSGFGKGIWYSSWYGIRKANIGLANLEILVNATQEEKDIIEGQLLFFRAYYHFVLMKAWGGLPYTDKVIGAADEMRYPRLKYQEAALKADADFAKAAELLPLNWDDTQVGQRTLGNNRLRIDKITALSFQGKNLLYAASPLMNRESTGDDGFNVDLSKKAADAFAQVINLCEQTNVYTLQPWDTYSDIFYTLTSPQLYPGGSEVIFQSQIFVQWQSQNGCVWGLHKLGHIPQHSGPTANYVKYWGMENGLPISDPGSGFDPANPWVNRDPRFYKTIVVDGDQITNANSAGPDQFAQLHTGGRHRDETASATGFITNKYWGLTCNKFDNGWSGSKFQFNIPLLRLSDVYLMYAEAVLQGFGSPQSSSAGSISALEAVNRVRNRANVPDVHLKFTDNKESFMEQIILERAVELSFEAHRWYDLRRWLKNGDPKYLDKTELLFDRDPITKKPINMQERLIVRRVVTETQNWLPFPIDVVSIYPDFQQNPGW